MRTCNKCGIEKEESEFYRAGTPGNPDRMMLKCKKCKNEQQNLYRFVTNRKCQRQYEKTVTGVLIGKHRATKRFCRKNNIVFELTIQEIRKLFEKNNQFLKMFSEWALSGYKMALSPCLARIDRKKGYIVGNLRMITWGELTTERNKTDLKRKRSRALK